MAVTAFVFALLYLISNVHPTNSVAFHLHSLTTFIHSCTPQGTWAVRGNVTISEADMAVFSQNLTFKVQDKELCTLDLELCPSVTSPMTSPSTLSPEVCECLGKFTDDDYSVYIRRPIDPSEAGLLLTAEVPAGAKFSPITSVHDVGKLPDVSSGNISYIINDGDATPLMSVQNITTCRETPLKLSVCAPTAQPGTVLKLSEKGQTILSPQACVHIIEEFSFQDVDSYPMMFTYDEGAGCPFHEQFLFNVYNDQSECETTTTTTSTTTTTTKTSTSAPSRPSCKESPTSLPRQPFTLSNGLRVLCDTKTDGGDWVIIQRRAEGDVDFYRGWTEYVAGFGNITGDFWLGLQDIHTLCPPSKPCSLRVDLKDPQYLNGDVVSAQYEDFSLDGFTENYRLHVGKYNGAAGDGLSSHNNLAFSTHDIDNDSWGSGNCAEALKAAWWFTSCAESSLNGVWGSQRTSDSQSGVAWYSKNDAGKWLYANYSEIKVRMQ